MNFYFAYVIYVFLCGLLLVLHWDVKVGEDETKGWFESSTLIVIAHPDDETMFFGPLLVSLISNSPDKIFILCLTSGDFYGLGAIRSIELITAVQQIGLPKVNLFLTDQFRDGFDQHWNSSLISLIVEEKIRNHNITHVITFDEFGVSHHPNHRDTHSFIKVFSSSSGQLATSVKFFLLESVSLHRKYLSFLDIPISLIDIEINDWLSNHKYPNQRKWFFGLTPSKYLKLVRALYAHESQMVWFRKVYSILSRYMFMNTLTDYNR
ncbi:N-acetylglucosaminyl-phosphatidylinositol de-N-acetylase-like [Panonychus citri]|uniref:N-acetylglucosaminyl-phosphatidylinositol de-N-acetylase-like n=1 Tax=Panonychus citri TaxID=50023 RepID=UPI002307372D|nr:N-acetylglucosaminyl-phosphatidylinositol de-N-acetylase-like [Panonychus citri]